MTNNVVVGIDGGGTRTRVIVADFGGRVLGTAERGGASTEFNDPEKARQNLREGVKTALADAERVPDDVAELTAGIGGLATPQSYTEAEQFLAIDALACETRVVNDAVVARAGAHNLGERALHALLGGEAPPDWRLGNRYWSAGTASR